MIDDSSPVDELCSAREMRLFTSDLKSDSLRLRNHGSFLQREWGRHAYAGPYCDAGVLQGDLLYAGSRNLILGLALRYPYLTLPSLLSYFLYQIAFFACREKLRASYSRTRLSQSQNMTKRIDAKFAGQRWLSPSFRMSRLCAFSTSQMLLYAVEEVSDIDARTNSTASMNQNPYMGLRSAKNATTDRAKAPTQWPSQINFVIPYPLFNTPPRL